MADKKVLIIIPVYNGVAEFLGDCLSSLRNISYPKENFLVLAIDDVSADNSAEFIRNNFPEIKVIENEKNLGFAGANNVGLQWAIDNGFDYAFMLNQDTAVLPEFLTEAVRLAESDVQIGLVQSKLLLFGQKDKINSRGNEIHFLGFAFAGGYLEADREMPAGEIAYASGAAMLIRVSALKEVGLLNEEFFMYHEDTDLGWRFWLAGFKVMLAPKSVVYHKYEFCRSIKKYYFMERNRYLVLLQNYKIATLLLILPAAMVMDFGMFVYSFLAGWWREEFMVYKYFFRPENWDKILKTRAAVQARRKVKDKEIVKRFTGQIKFQEIGNPLLKYLVNPLLNLYWRIVRVLVWW